jgi:hypothetical protein
LWALHWWGGAQLGCFVLIGMTWGWGGMALVLLTQYFDTLRDIGTRSGSNTIFLPNSPGAANDFMTQILAGLRGNAGLSTHP